MAFEITEVVGTRPNFVKMASVHRSLVQLPDAHVRLLHTGQHFDSEMSKVFFEDLGLPVPDANLGVSGGSQTSLTARTMEAFESQIVEHRPDLVVVVGDVNASLAAAMVCSKERISVAHIEAGLRSNDRRMPEEINRIIIDHLSDYLFVTEESGVANLSDEGIAADSIFLVGNVMIDTLIANREKADRSQVLDKFNVSTMSYGVVTLHRPSNVDDSVQFAGILETLRHISLDLPLVFPVHPRTRKRIRDDNELQKLVADSQITLSGPLGYLDFLKLLADSCVVLTDSGGIQEETTALGVPCVTLRDNTERPATITHGSNVLAGTTRDGILSAYRNVLKRSEALSKPPLWDGGAAERIRDILAAKLNLRVS